MGGAMRRPDKSKFGSSTQLRSNIFHEKFLKVAARKKG
jgi:hypothetical protein